VVAELEFDSVIPPPDIVEEESLSLIPQAPTIQAKVSSKPEIDGTSSDQLQEKGCEIQFIVSQSAIYTTLIVRLPELNPLVNDCR
jgi:hypothetical protein